MAAYLDYKKIVGNNVRALRNKAHLSQALLAKRTALYRPYLSRIETGHANPTLSVLLDLADALGVHICALFSVELRAV